MKQAGVLLGTIALALALTGNLLAKSSDKKETKTGDTTVIAYEGHQSWPTAKSAQIMQGYAVPVYQGLPDKKYKVLGRIVDERNGVDEVGRAFGEAFGSQKHRIRDCANQAKLNGGDAVMVTDDERVLKALDTSMKSAKEESPLIHEQHKVVLIIKF
ncbi:MAG TPA: hypothetical protein VL171_13745 [Verrucomicrobiae bacterium]|nr:hypothetical protein [Verrucomicrobiae bacterium]